MGIELHRPITKNSNNSNKSPLIATTINVTITIKIGNSTSTSSTVNNNNNLGNLDSSNMPSSINHITSSTTKQVNRHKN